MTRLGRLERLQGRIAATVRARVGAACLERARRQGSLARLLADTAARELEGPTEEPDAAERGRAEAFFRALAREASEASEARQRELLAATIDGFVGDIAARFDARLFRAGAALTRVGLGLAFSPLGEGLSAWRPLEERLRVEGPLERLRDLSRRDTLVFAPTHSSNLDSPVLGLSLIRAGLPPVVYAAGKHLFRNRLLGAFLRRVGAYRVDRGRRSALYGLVLAEYSTVLLELGFHAAIFPGGTRNRTNEVEPSVKLGLLRTAARAAPRHGRIHVVPVTINYQVVLEADTLVRYQLAGRGRERIRGDELLARGRLRASASRLRALDQAAVVRFAGPLDPGEPSLAASLVRAYRRETVFFATHLVARALDDLLAARPGATRFGEGEVHGALGALLSAIRGDDGAGRLHPDLERAAPAELVARALRAWDACHDRPVVARSGGDLLLADASLLAFYRNRTSHVVR